MDLLSRRVLCGVAMLLAYACWSRASLRPSVHCTVSECGYKSWVAAVRGAQQLCKPGAAAEA